MVNKCGSNMIYKFVSFPSELIELWVFAFSWPTGIDNSPSDEIGTVDEHILLKL